MGRPVDTQGTEQLAAAIGEHGPPGACGRRLSIGGSAAGPSVARPAVRGSFEAAHVPAFQRPQAGRIDGRTVAERSGRGDRAFGGGQSVHGGGGAARAGGVWCIGARRFRAS